MRVYSIDPTLWYKYMTENFTSFRIVKYRLPSDYPYAVQQANLRTWVHVRSFKTLEEARLFKADLEEPLVVE